MDRLRAQKGRSHHHLIAKDKVVDDQVMAVDLPAPGFGGGRLPHNTHPIEILTVLRESTGHFHDRLIETHDVARGLKSLGAQALSEHRESTVALSIAHLEKRHAMAHQRGMDVTPSAPFDCIYREEGF